MEVKPPMIAGQAIVLAITDASMVGEARRAASGLAKRLGFDESAQGRVAIVATEAASNLHRHAQSGELIVCAVEQGEAQGVELLAVDRGPGMADVRRCLADGYSTAGTPGTGLGAISRLAHSFEIHSQPGGGTVVLAVLWNTPLPPLPPRGGLQCGAISVPVSGEDVCGDSWAVAESAGQFLLLVADGLGHGPLAADAAREAVRAFHAHASQGPAAILHAAHDMLRSTRGAAVAIAQVDLDRGQVRYCGVGNISGAILDASGKRTLNMVSHNGTVGHALRKVQEFVYPWTDGGILVMHSDGLASHWQLEPEAGLGAVDPRVVAAVLYRDFRRSRDDVTVLAARQPSRSLP